MFVSREEKKVELDPFAPIRILVVEDDDALREMIVELLDVIGRKPVACNSAESALAEMEREPADVVLSDIKMPGIDGVELMRRIRRSWPNTEVVMITAFATIEATLEALRHGALDLLIKPVRVEQIEKVVLRCEERVRFVRAHKDLRHTMSRLLELNNRKEQFAAIVNHELRTPTAVSYGLLQLLEKKSSQLPDDVTDLVTRAKESLGKLSEVVNDLGDLATATTDQQWIKPKPCRVSNIIVELEAASIEFKRVRKLDVAVSNLVDEDITINVDRRKLVRAVVELMRNAVKSTPDGGMIAVNVSISDGKLTFRVEDSGIGVAEAERERIFEPFYTTGDAINHHSSSCEEFGGCGIGIGLPLAKSVAVAHNGDLVCSQREGGGSRFDCHVDCR